MLFKKTVEILGSGAWLAEVCRWGTAFQIYSLAPLCVLSDCRVRDVMSQELAPAVTPSPPRWTLSSWNPFFLKLLCQSALSQQQSITNIGSTLANRQVDIEAVAMSLLL